jgi:hypothetical protein
MQKETRLVIDSLFASRDSFEDGKRMAGVSFFCFLMFGKHDFLSERWKIMLDHLLGCKKMVIDQPLRSYSAVQQGLLRRCGYRRTMNGTGLGHPTSSFRIDVPPFGVFGNGGKDPSLR